MSVSAKPMVRPANPTGALRCVAPSMTTRNMNVITTSVTTPAISEYPPGECSPKPLAAKFPGTNPGLPLAIRKSVTAAAIAPATCATTYAGIARAGNRPPAQSPTVTAGLKCPPEIGPSAYAAVSTDRPNASETPTKPMPKAGKAPATTALPQPASTSQNVPRNSLDSFAPISALHFSTPASRLPTSDPPDFVTNDV